jgi:hypothetical protein
LVLLDKVGKFLHNLSGLVSILNLPVVVHYGVSFPPDEFVIGFLPFGQAA